MRRVALGKPSQASPVVTPERADIPHFPMVDDALRMFERIVSQDKVRPKRFKLLVVAWLVGWLPVLMAIWFAARRKTWLPAPAQPPARQVVPSPLCCQDSCRSHVVSCVACRVCRVRVVFSCAEPSVAFFTTAAGLLSGHPAGQRSRGDIRRSHARQRRAVAGHAAQPRRRPRGQRRTGPISGTQPHNRTTAQPHNHTTAHAHTSALSGRCKWINGEPGGGVKSQASDREMHDILNWMHDYESEEELNDEDDEDEEEGDEKEGHQAGSQKEVEEMYVSFPPPGPRGGVRST